MVQGRRRLSKNVLGVHRNNVSRLIESSRKKMLLYCLIPYLLSGVCGLADSAFCDNLADI